jgi:pentatricopeptide repeat protein
MLDFGLAKLAEKHEVAADAPTKTELDQTTPGMVVGTVNYMSPEQALGKELDHRTDIFSFGVVLYEMITGRRAFEGNTSAAVFDAILNRTPTAPVTLNADVPEKLQRIVDKALEKDPALRYQSAAGLRADLRRLQRDVAGDRDQLIYRPERAPKIRSIAAITGAALILAVAGLLYWQSREEGDAPAFPEPATTLSKGPSIAVLPFVNASGDPEQDYFATGLAQEIITELTRYPDLNVVARYAAFRYEGDPADLGRIREALGGVRYVLRGNVARAGDTIRLTADLSDTRDGSQLWGESYTRDLTATGFFALQDELTNQVVGAITSSYGPISRAGLAEARRKPPGSLDSYDCVLRAYQYLNIHESPQHLAARDCLERAVERDADYADAWAWLAYTYAEEQRHQWNVRPGYDALERALEAANRGLEVDATNQVARAAPMMRRALELNPNPPPWYYMAIFWDHYNHGRYEEALKHALYDETAYRDFVYRAACLARLGRPEEARRALEEMHASGYPVPDDFRRDMIEQQGFAPAVADRLLEPLEGIYFPN